MTQRFANLSALGWTAVACLMIACVVAVVQAGSIVPLLVSRGAAPAERGVATGVKTYAAALDRNARRIDNRSPFFVPPRPAPKVVERPKPVEKPKAVSEPKQEKAPRRYGGPDIIAMLGDSVWLETGSRVQVGDEADGVRVISTTPPWGARVAWRGAEFDVTLFERTTDQFLNKDELDNDEQAGDGDDGDA